MRLSILYLLSLSVFLASCNPFTWLQNNSQDNKGFAIIFLIAGLITLVAAGRFVFKTLKKNSLAGMQNKEIIDNGLVLLLYILPALFFIVNGLNTYNKINKLNFYTSHVRDFTYKTADELALDSEYKKVDYLILRDKKVMAVKSGTGEWGWIEAGREHRGIDPVDVEYAGEKTSEERIWEAFKLNLEFDDPLYSRLPGKFKVLDEQDFKAVRIIIQKDYSGTVVGKYTNGSKAVRKDCNVVIYDIVDKTYIKAKYFAGTDPPDVIGPHSGSNDSEIPEQEFLKYIMTVIKEK
jgi:hypothetical protein